MSNTTLQNLALTTPLFIEVPVPCQAMYLCAKVVNFAAFYDLH